MSRPHAGVRWSRSFYWRIAFGFVLCLVGVLAAQAGVMLWLIDRAEFAGGVEMRKSIQEIADDLATALAADPTLDLGAYVARRFPQPDPPFIVSMHDGRAAAAGVPLPPFLGERGRGRFNRAPPAGLELRRWVAPPRQPAVSEIVIAGQPAGMVMPSPRGQLIRRGWLTAGVGFVLVIAGTTLAALLVFRPLRKRMNELEQAARRIGEGDADARAPQRGNDEWAGLARTFNGMAEDLQARAKQIQVGERMRRVLLADVSHELRTPLTTMRGYLETLTASPLTPETTRRHVEVVREEARRLERIVGDLLDLAKLEAAADVLDVQDIPLEGLFGRVVARSELEAARRGTELSTFISTGAEIVVGDPLRIEQALQNLTANALRHTPAGGRIDLTAEPSAAGVNISVRDTGVGIPDEHIPFVFDRFYKVDASRSLSSTGSGLGLSIVKAIVERHGGSVSVQSAVGHGTKFTIHLPDADPTVPVLDS